MRKCNLKQHPDANRSSTKWAESVKEKEWKVHGNDFIPKQIKDKSTRIDSTPDMKGRASIKTKLSQKTPTHANKKHKGEKPCCMLCQMCHNTDEKSSSILVAHCDNIGSTV